MQENCSTCKLNKYAINGFLIVEGTSDKAFLSSFLDCEIIWVGGNALPRGTIDYIIQLSRVYTPIIMTDPDIAGERINKRLKALVPNAQNALINLDPNKIGKKNGVAESSKKEVLRVLKPYIINQPLKKGSISEAELIMLGLDNKKAREFVQNSLEIGISNLKSFTNRLNCLNISIDEIKKVLKAYGN